MKYSKQREMIYQTVQENPIHPTADVVYQMVREKIPTVSLGTVYRNLNMLTEQGRLCKISLPNQSDHFDGRIDQHQHILCEKCGKVFDIDIPQTADLLSLVGANQSFLITGCTLHLTGVCSDCAQTH